MTTDVVRDGSVRRASRPPRPARPATPRPAAPRAARPAPDVHPRMAARATGVAREGARRRGRRVLRLLLVVLVVAGAFVVTRSPLLDVDRVVLTGAERTDRATLLDALGIAPGRPMASIDEDAAAARLRALPWVADASVAVDWPGTVRVRVRERTAVAQAGRGAAAVQVDAEGRALGPADAERPLPSIGSVAPEVGERVSAAARVRAGAVAGLPGALRSQVDEVRTDDGSIVAELDDGIEVRLGEPTQLRTKGEAVLALLDQADRTTIASIDVAVPGAAALTRNDGGGA